MIVTIIFCILINVILMREMPSHKPVYFPPPGISWLGKWAVKYGRYYRIGHFVSFFSFFCCSCTSRESPKAIFSFTVQIFTIICAPSLLDWKLWIQTQNALASARSTYVLPVFQVGGLRRQKRQTYLYIICIDIYCDDAEEEQLKEQSIEINSF